MQDYVLSLSDFLELFPNHKTKITWEDFLESARVSSLSKEESLKTYLKKTKKTEESIKILHAIYNDQQGYLTRFYTISLKPFSKSMKTVKVPENIFNNITNKMFKNLIRNLYFSEILEETETGIKNLKSYLRMIKDFFNHLIIDYKLLTPSVLSLLERVGPGPVFAGLYFRASIMNPYLVYSIANRYLEGPNNSVFTPTLGWSSYLYGFLESGLVKQYVGIDVIPSVCNKSERMFKELYPKTDIKIHCLPSEDLWHQKSTIRPYKNKMNLVFFSPPYFQLELYKGGDQSTDRYKSYPDWLDGYWRQTIKLSHYVLKSSGLMIYIISGYGSDSPIVKSQIGGAYYVQLEKDMAEIAQEYFELKEMIQMGNTNVGITSHRQTGETIFVFTPK